jgi:hypothetical protein
VLVFWFWREIVFGVTYVLSVQYSCAVVSVFWLWWEIVLKMRTRFYKKILLGYFIMIYSRCVYFIRPNTLLLYIFLFCIFLLYRADPQVEVQIRILFKDKYRKSRQNAFTGNPTLISRTMFVGFLYFREKKIASQDMFLVRSKLSITAYCFLVLYRSTSLQSLSYLKNIKTFLCK